MNTLIWAKVHLALYYLTKMPEKKKLIDFFSLKKKKVKAFAQFCNGKEHQNTQNLEANIYVSRKCF